ncbi:MAG: ribonuclease III [Syntrophales bacterium]|nr:ribonuclease III [Syntrophales bacterium]
MTEEETQMRPNSATDSSNSLLPAGDEQETKGLSEERIEALRNFEQIFSYHFGDISLLDNALTHRSFVHENPTLDCKDNERLEFLGDAVLELCISDLLMKMFPDYTEGQLSKRRSSLVNEQPLADLARRFKIGDYLLLGKGEESSGGRVKNSILANTFEAVIAAVYLDCGLEKTEELIKNLIDSLIERGERILVYRDYKTAVQEISQTRFKEIPRYILLGEYGPDHDKVFEVRLSIAHVITACGTGKNKKEAEQQAAKKAYEELQKTVVSHKS